MKNRNIKALPIEDHGDTDAIFIDDVAAIMERGTVTHVILASVQATADSELPTAMYRRVMVRLIIPTDRRYEIGKQIAAGPDRLARAALPDNAGWVPSPGRPRPVVDLCAAPGRAGPYHCQCQVGKDGTSSG